MAGNLSIVPSDHPNTETQEPPYTITKSWQIHYSHFFRFHQNNANDNLLTSSSTSTKLKPLHKWRNGGTWVAAASTATLQITSDFLNPQPKILTVSLDGKIIEEHYTSSLQFSLLQVSCVTECSTKGSKVVLASYKDTNGQIQKFAMRFRASSHAATFINSLQAEGISKSTKQAKRFSPGEVSEEPTLMEIEEAKSVSKKRKRKDPKSFYPDKENMKNVIDTGHPGSSFASKISSESMFVTSDRSGSSGDELSFVEPLATSAPPVASNLNYSGNQKESSQGALLGYNYQNIPVVDMPPSFTTLLTNCSGVVEQEQVYVPVMGPEEDDLKSQIMRYMSDPYFHDILAKVDKVFTEMGGFL